MRISLFNHGDTMAKAGKRVAIIGAGMAGLACAARLCRAGHSPKVFDKGRSPGGRMSTRRLDTRLGQASFDHGAQYFTARGDAFRHQVGLWAAEGLVAPWPVAGPEAWVGVPGMTAPLRKLALEQSVTLGFPIDALLPDGGAWRLNGPLGVSDLVNIVVVALPAEQAAILLAGHEPALETWAAGSRTDPCWTVMAAFDQSISIEADVLREQGPLGWAARNSSKPGRDKTIETWVLQGNPDWSRQHLEDSAETVCNALLDALQQSSSKDLPRPIVIQAHRWRFARSARGTEGALWSPQSGLGCCGDWLIGPRVECAYESGTALAERLINDPTFAFA
jgi:renalase